jgi:hypothetical protein
MIFRFSKALFLAVAVLGPLGAARAEGVPIKFSGRDGRPVRFDYSRREVLVPPELQESQFGKSSGEASFLPLMDASVTPNSGSGRRRMNGERQERDWIFQNPGDSASKDSREARTGLDRETEEPAMMKFMRGDQSGEDRSSKNREDLPDEQKAEVSGHDEQNSDRSAMSRNDKARDFSGLSGKRESFLSRLESDAGLNASQDGMTLRNYFQAEQHRERELKHQERMTDFRQMLNSPFSAPSSGSGFGGSSALPLDSVPGQPVSFGLPSFGDTGKPGVPGIDFGKTAGIPGAFDTANMPADLGGRRAFQDRKPEPIRRQIKMDIPKRDF